MPLQPLTNRNFELPKDGWYQIAPKGEHPHPTGIVQILDDESLQTMKNRFDEQAKEPNFAGVLMDYDHFSNDPKAKSEASGWITELENRADGLWAKIRWSNSGEKAVTGGDYRFASPVWLKGDCEAVGDPVENKFRPMRLDRCALTNDPNLKGMVPLSNRADGTADNENLVTREEMATAIAEAVKNAGTSAGAHKGWETRRGALGAYHESTGKELSKYADRREKAGATREAASVRATADNHLKLAAKYKGKAAVSGAKAHINRELDKLRGSGKKMVYPTHTIHVAGADYHVGPRGVNWDKVAPGDKEKVKAILARTVKEEAP